MNKSTADSKIRQTSRSIETPKATSWQSQLTHVNNNKHDHHQLRLIYSRTRVALPP